MNKILTFILAAILFLFLIAVYALIIQVFGIDNTNKATIIGGVLSMIGGAFGAFGAYLVARHQMNKQNEHHEELEKINARPIISCLEFKGPTKLNRVNMNQNARLLVTEFYDKNSDYVKIFNFYEFKVLGNTKAIFDCKVKVTMDEVHGDNSLIEAHLGIMENNTEVFIPLPFVVETSECASYPLKVEVLFETSEGEKMKYEYSVNEKCERYILIENGQEVLLKELKLLSGVQWILPGRIR